MKTDPRLRKDGKCHVCKKPRTPKLGKTGMTSKHGDPTYLAARELDPFCSTECCRVYFDNQISGRRKDGEEITPDKRAGRAPFPHGTRKGYRMCACDKCKAAVGK